MNLCAAALRWFQSREHHFRLQPLLTLLLSALPLLAGAQVNVYTRSYDLSRTGANLNETVLTPANVNPTQFGKLFTVKTDGEIYAQPLYVANLNIAGVIRNVVYAATMRNSVYAIDADTGQQLWVQNFGTPINPQEVQSDQNISWSTGLGILGTPVIDPSTNIMYFVSANEYQSNGANVYENHLNAIDITTGLPVNGSPVNITATFNSPDISTGLVFDAKHQNQRPGLALSHGMVYIAFASHNDITPYHGWVLAYNASTLAQVATFSDTTVDMRGGIWMAGAAPAIDQDGNLYLSTGNGNFGPTKNGVTQTGNSFIKLSPTLQLLDYFTPKNSATLNSGDMDLGSAGLLLLPNTTHVLGGGKEGVLYITDINNMGKFNSSQDQVLQEFQSIYGVGTSHIHGTPVYFNSSVNGPSAYVWGENDVLRAYQFDPDDGLLNTTPFAMSPMTAPVTNNNGAMPGGFISISANGNQNGILWASTPYNANALHNIVQGVLYAFDANTLNLLWSDKQNDSRDEIGLFAKYCPPVVANGKLYMATFGKMGTSDGSGALVVYGLLPKLTVSVQDATMTSGASSLPAFTATATGLKGSDQLGGSLIVQYSTTATTNSAPGTYSVTATVSGTAASNYYITVNPGTLTVYPAVSSSGTGALSYNSSFSPDTIQVNGAAKFAGSILRLTDSGTYEAASAFYSTPVNVQSFTNDFTFQLTNPNGDGFAFVIQNTGKNALGAMGGNLGYAPSTWGVLKSVAIKFDLYSNAGEGTNSTGIYTNGAAPNVPSISLAGSGIDLHSGKVYKVHQVYDGKNLTVTIIDPNTGTSATQTYAIDIPGTVGGSTAYVGFTAGTGQSTATQDILSWTYAPQPYYPSGFASAQLALNGGAALNGTALRVTDGGQYEARSAFFPTQVNIQQFTTSFNFQLKSANGDGFAFVIQGTGPNAVGPLGGGLGYGADAGQNKVYIPKSLAIKFDLYSNIGEGRNSTGLYINGASPTTPFIDLSSTGISLHSEHIFNATLVYNLNRLKVTITDTATNISTTQFYNVHIPTIVDSPTAYVGFTGGTGGSTATQDIQSWTFNAAAPIPTAALLLQSSTLSSTTSGPALNTVSWSGFPDGLGTVLSSTKLGDSASFTVNAPQSTTYDLAVSAEKLPNRAMFQLSVDGKLVGTGISEDEYGTNVNGILATYAIGRMNLTAGNHTFTVTTTSKNSSSSDWTLSFGQFSLTPP